MWGGGATAPCPTLIPPPIHIPPPLPDIPVRVTYIQTKLKDQGSPELVLEIGKWEEENLTICFSLNVWFWHTIHNCFRDCCYITIYEKYFSESVRLCPNTSDWQNDGAMCNRHGLSWRCIREAQSALCSQAGPARHWARAVNLSLSRAPVSRVRLRMPPSHSHAGPSSLSPSERRGNSSLS